MRETIWAARGLYWDDPSIVYPTPTQYTRTDVADARIKELEGALRVIEGGVVAMNQPAEKAMRSVARAVLKGDANED